MYPRLIQVGDYVVPPYSIFLWLGIGVGVLVALRLGRRVGLAERDLLVPAAFAVGLALVGARLFSVLFDGDLEGYLERPSRVFEFWRGGLVYYGGLLGGIVGALVGARRRGVPFLELADTFAPGVTIGLAFGRVGCLLTGCCFGAPTDFPIAIVYDDPLSHVHPLHTPLHAAPLYEAIFALVVGLGLVWLHARRRGVGEVLAWALVAYAPGRFLLELLRADSRGALLGLSTSQWISIALFAAGLVLMRRLRPVPIASAATRGRSRRSPAGSRGR